MTQEERLSAYLPDKSDDEIDELLQTSKSIILCRRFPYGELPDEIENRYLDLQIRIAVELDAKSGAEGETRHTENGVDRTYASEWVSPSLLNEITPKVGML